MNVSVLQMFKLNKPNRSHRSTHIVDVLVRLGLNMRKEEKHDSKSD